MIRVLIADDHPMITRGLRQILAEHADMAVAGEASTAQELFALVRQRQCDAVLLDISMPGKNGLEALKELKKEYPGLPVLMLSAHPEDQYAVRALRAGASGYLTKDRAPSELVAAIRKITTGGRYVSSSLAEKLAEGVATDNGRPPHESLSDREYEVLCMIASGKVVTEIAAELSLSVKTISTYRSRILDKMAMKNNAALTHYAIQNRLVT